MIFLLCNYQIVWLLSLMILESRDTCVSCFASVTAHKSFNSWAMRVFWFLSLLILKSYNPWACDSWVLWHFSHVTLWSCHSWISWLLCLVYIIWCEQYMLRLNFKYSWLFNKENMVPCSSWELVKLMWEYYILIVPMLWGSREFIALLKGCLRLCHTPLRWNWRASSHGTNLWGFQM